MKEEKLLSMRDIYEKVLHNSKLDGYCVLNYICGTCPFHDSIRTNNCNDTMPISLRSDKEAFAQYIVKRFPNVLIEEEKETK